MTSTKCTLVHTMQVQTKCIKHLKMTAEVITERLESEKKKTGSGHCVYYGKCIQVESDSQRILTVQKCPSHLF